MADEERNEDVTPEEEQPATPDEETAPAEEEAAPAEEEAAPAEEEAAPAEEEAAPAEEEAAPAEEDATQPEDSSAEASGEVAEAEDESVPASEPEPADTGRIPAPPESPVAAAPSEDVGGVVKAKDLPPGAELEPISLEPDRPLDAEERARLEAEEEERARLEAEATADGGEEPVARSGPRIELDAGRSIQATGKRKSSIARVILRSGSGSFEVNRRPLEGYFPRAHLQTIARQALVTSGYEDSLDVTVRVQGGGLAGQAGAIRHGIAKGLTEIDAELRGELKRRGYLTRDARIKERRKAGLKKARKRPQFSKR